MQALRAKQSWFFRRDALKEQFGKEPSTVRCLAVKSALLGTRPPRKGKEAALQNSKLLAIFKQKLRLSRTVQRTAFCRSRRELSNVYLLAKFGFVTAENELSKVCPLDRSSLVRRQITDLKNCRSQPRPPFCEWAAPAQVEKGLNAMLKASPALDDLVGPMVKEVRALRLQYETRLTLHSDLET